ncbi:Aste57867_5078 [Aphanomyces stellatus]|uniref:Aste57867_5078 protein n=1 Tax=Aphanomyces stellatus TaxID=120398 RepID=A0A485KDT8_9STRA|nr:hypothetical protein As57867_005065 [Aphanomyces stellatus]VFT82159.1 Aste57867_5078 [Aphanomyces stellatus]
MKIVICGGGVIGCTLAYYLVHSDDFGEHDEVIVVEEVGVAAAASGKAGGFLASNWCQGEDINGLCQLSFRLHEELARVADGTTIYDYRRVDTISCVVTTKPSKSRKLHTDNIVPAWVRGHVVESHAIGDKATCAQVHPRKFTETMLRLAMATGKARLVHGAVSGLLHGPQRGVVVDGMTIEADAVVLAMGPWTFPCLTQWLEFPSIAPPEVYKIHSVVLESARTAAFDPIVVFGELKESHNDVEIVPRPDGSVYACGPRDAEPLPASASLVLPTAARVAELIAGVAAFDGAAAESEVVAKQACYLPSTKDNIPVVGRVQDGIYVAAGHGCWGVLNAPATALALSQLVLTGHTTCVDLSPFAPARYTMTFD